jgi:soluble lytic murein transglycosylase-like protein
VTRHGAVLLGVLGLLLTASAEAQTFRLEAPDGTVHFTNAPTDPRYRRLGLVAPPGRAALPSRAPVATGSASRFDDFIRDAAARYGVPERLIRAVIRVESGFNPRAVSRKGARGLMQLMPETATRLGVRDSFDPSENIDGGVRHLRGLIDRLGQLPLVLAAYNAGERAVASYRGIPPYPETRDYVTRVMELFNNTVEALPRPVPGTVYRTIGSDGAIVYTNIPPRGRL